MKLIFDFEQWVDSSINSSIDLVNDFCNSGIDENIFPVVGKVLVQIDDRHKEAISQFITIKLTYLINRFSGH